MIILFIMVIISAVFVQIFVSKNLGINQTIDDSKVAKQYVDSVSNVSNQISYKGRVRSFSDLVLNASVEDKLILDKIYTVINERYGKQVNQIFNGVGTLCGYVNSKNNTVTIEECTRVLTQSSYDIIEFYSDGNVINNSNVSDKVQFHLKLKSDSSEYENGKIEITESNIYKTTENDYINSIPKNIINESITIPAGADLSSADTIVKLNSDELEQKNKTVGLNEENPLEIDKFMKNSVINNNANYKNTDKKLKNIYLREKQ